MEHIDYEWTNTYQYFSDVHTEMYKSYPSKIHSFKIDVNAPYLILAGDIGHPHSEVYVEFLKMLSPKFKQIFIIAGNHEYYQTPSIKKLHIPDYNWMNVIDDKIRDVTSSFDNITFLQNEYYKFPDSNIIVFGGTFWTDVKKEEESDVRYYLNDYRNIPGFTLEQGVKKHKEACDKLKCSLEENPDSEFIVISHHLPSYELVNSRYLNIKPALNSAYATDIDIANHPRIKAWVAGHTHTPVQKGKFYVNPIGYPGEIVRDFNKVFRVK